MRKFSLNKIPSVESSEIQPELLSVSNEPTSVEPVEMDEHAEDDLEVTEYSDGCNELCNTVTALESLVTSMESSLASGGLNRQAYDFAQMHARHLATNIGLEITIPSLESAGGRLAGTQIAIESIKETASKAITAIIEFVKKLFSKIVDSCKAIAGSIDNKISRVIKKVKSMKDDAFETPIELPTQFFYIKGALSKNLTKDIPDAIKMLVDLGARMPSPSEYHKIFLISGTGQFDTEFQKLSVAVYRSFDEYLKFDDRGFPTKIFAGTEQWGFVLDAEGKESDASGATKHLTPTFKHVSNKPAKVKISQLGLTKNTIDGLEAAKKYIQEYSDMILVYSTETQKSANELNVAAISNMAARQGRNVTQMQATVCKTLYKCYTSQISVITTLLKNLDLLTAAVKE